MEERKRLSSRCSQRGKTTVVNEALKLKSEGIIQSLNFGTFMFGLQRRTISSRTDQMRTLTGSPEAAAAESRQAIAKITGMS